MADSVFSEVLKIGIDTASFAEQMKAVENIYAQSLSNMPDLADMGQVAAANSFSVAAQQIAEAAASIESHVAEMSADVERAMERVGTSARTAAPKVAEDMAKIPVAAKEAQTSMERFASGFETAMYRIPGRMAVIAALNVVMTALKAPIKALEEGFNNLAAQSQDFKTTKTDLQDMFSILESIAAKPIFDTVLKGMHELRDWLDTNKEKVEEIAFALGNLVNAAVSPLVDAMEKHPVGLIEAVSTLVTALGYGASLIKLVILEVADMFAVLGDNDMIGKGWKVWYAEFKEKLAKAKKDFQEFGAEVSDITAANIGVSNAAEGNGAKPPEGILPAAEVESKTTQVNTEFQNEIAGLKDRNQKLINIQKERTAVQIQNKDQERIAIKAIGKKELADIDEYVSQATEKLKKIPGLTDVNLKNAIDKLQRSVGGSANEIKTGIYNRDTAADDAAKAEAIKHQDDLEKAHEALIEKDYQSEVKTAKEAAAHLVETHKQSVGEIADAEDKRHRASLANIETIYHTGVEKTPGQDRYEAAIAAETEKHKNAEIELADEEVSAGKTDDELTAKRLENAKKVIEIRQKGAEAEAKILGDKRVQKEAQDRQEQQDLANLQEQMAEARKDQGATTYGTPGAVDADNRVATLQAQIDVLQKRIADQSKGATSASSVDQTLNLQRLETLAKINGQQAKLANNKKEELAATKQLLDIEIQKAKLNVDNANIAAGQAFKSGDQAALKDALDRLAIANAQLAQLEGQRTDVNYSKSAIGEMQRQQAGPNPGTAQADSALEKMGVNVSTLNQDLDNSSTVFGKLQDVLVDGVIPFLKNFSQLLETAYTDFKKGNIGGGVSAASNAAGGALGGLSKMLGSDSAIGSALSSASSEIPIIGGMIGGMFSAITGFFSASIQTMVTDLQDQIQAINLQASTKQIGIQQQIAELKQAEQTAQAELGGKKKAQSQLQAIMQSLNSQITTLQYQAQQTVQTFNDMVNAANAGTAAGNQVATNWLNTWTQINQQVEAYVQAGGSLATAATYLNQQLQQQQQTLTTGLNSGYSTAIGDALQLNQLEQQKVDMMKQEAATEFGMLNADSLERRTASAVQTGVALTNQRNQFSLQMQTMNQQIALEQGRVAAEGQVFNINMSIAQLQNQQNTLNIAALQQQLNQYKEMQAILAATAGINYTPGNINPQWGLNGSQAPVPGLPGVAGNVAGGNAVINGGINVTVNGNVTTDNVADLGTEIATNIRSGRSTFSVASAAA